MASSSIIEKMLNLNIGVLGHVDAGKTSLVKELSSHLSTASLDKHPQSRERGITLDLGFSSFLIPLPKRLEEERSKHPDMCSVDTIQITLVDCPGHASLIRTIIGGAQIIDMVMLVIDVTHGIQSQTVECVIIAEICTNDMIIVLNKIDMLPEDDRDKIIEQQKRAIKKSLQGSKFENAPMVCVAAAVGGEKVAAIQPQGKGGGREGGAGPDKEGVIGIDDLYSTLESTIKLPRRQSKGPLFLAVDHCFPIKGQGTILTGTVLSGEIAVNDMVELPNLVEQRKVKSMQMFHQSVKRAKQGDRVGVCVTNLDSKAIERGVLCTPGSIRPIDRAIAVIRKVRAYRGPAETGSKMHISVGHSTVMAKVTFFGVEELRGLDLSSSSSSGRQDGSIALAASLVGDEGQDVPQLGFKWDMDYVYQEEMKGRRLVAKGSEEERHAIAAERKDEEESASNGSTLSTEGSKGGQGNRASRFLTQYVLLEFESPVMCPTNSLVIGSRLDGKARVGGRDGSSSSSSSGSAGCSRSPSGEEGGACRIAFYGSLIESVKQEDMKRIRIYKEKFREGSIHRLGTKVNEEQGDVYQEVTGQGFFKKETDLTAFMGMLVETEDGQVGRIESGFGKTGKFKVSFPSGGVKGVKPGDKLYLRFQKFLYDSEKEMRQNIQLGRKVSSSSSNGRPAASSSAVQAASPPTERLSSLYIEAFPPPVPQAEEKREEKVEVAAAGAVAIGGGKQEKEKTFSGQEGTEEMYEKRYGEVDAIKADDVVIATGLFSMEEDIKRHVGLRVVAEDGHEGQVIGPFGKAGKAKIQFAPGFDEKVGSKLTLYFVSNPL